MKPKLFAKVRCAAYLKKIKDGVHIILFNPDGTICENKHAHSPDCKAIAYAYDYKKGEFVEIADLSSFECECVEKVFRERIEEEFTGVVVGYTTVKVTGLLGTVWEENYNGDEFGHCFKEVKYAPKVAVVYFKNNCKRYVLLEDLQEIRN